MSNALFDVANLNGQNGFFFNSIPGLDREDMFLASAGDVNGDGQEDLLVATPFDDSNGNDSGKVYLVYGRDDLGATGSFDLNNLSVSEGFEISGIYQWGRLGSSVSEAGDVNGDGFDDIIVGAPSADPTDPNDPTINRIDAGQSYVIYGGLDIAPSGSFDLNSLDGTNGLTINGINVNDMSGTVVVGVGDFNGDGYDDMAISAPNADPNGKADAGEVYLVFGQASGLPETLELSSLDGTNGITFEGVAAGDKAGMTISSGDRDDDGSTDLVISTVTGQSYVVFGTNNSLPARFELASLLPVNGGDGSQGFVIDAPNWRNVRFIGDTNGDGYEDAIIASQNGSETYVAFGNATSSPSLALSDLEDGTQGFQVEYVDNGISRSITQGEGQQDINGDGYTDMVFTSGSNAFVLFGDPNIGSGGTVNLAELDGENGFTVATPTNEPYIFSVEFLNDINGDRLPELSLSTDFGAGTTNPRTRIIFGNIAPEIDLNGSGEGITTTLFTGSPVAVVGSEISLADFSLDINNQKTALDPNSATLSGITIRIQNPLASGAEILNADTTNTNITANYDATTGTLQLSGEATITDYEQVLQTVTYNNTGIISGIRESVLEFVVDDGAAHSNTSQIATTTILTDLNGKNGFLFDPILDLDRTNMFLAGAGDLNGDGQNDLLVGTPYDDSNGEDSGKVYIVYGDSGLGATGSLDLNNLSVSDGFEISGIYLSGLLSSSISGVGDINDDGFDDIIVSAPSADPTDPNDPNNDRIDAGQSYVIYGGSNLAPSGSFDLNSLDGTNGLTINGINVNDMSGTVVVGVEDFNGDGYDDMAISAPNADPSGKTDAGEVYLVFGQASGLPETLELSSLDGTNGITFEGVAAGDKAGTTISSGDWDGDDLTDLVISTVTGQSYVVFGTDDLLPANFELASLLPANGGDGSQGFVIDAPNWRNVRFIGDTNGDGYEDAIIASQSGSETYVAFGNATSSSSLALSDLDDGTQGFQVEYVENSISRSITQGKGAEDINGDGYTDMVFTSGSNAFVLFGGSNVGSNGTVNLAEIDDETGFTVVTPSNEPSIFSVEFINDINGDRLPELAFSTDFGIGTANSRTRIIFGNIAPEIDLNGSGEGINTETFFTGNPVAVVGNEISLADFGLDANSQKAALDPNSATVSGITIRIQTPLTSGTEILSADTTNTSISANYNAMTGTLQLIGEGTIAEYEHVLQTVTYDNTAITSNAITPDMPDRILEFVVNDGAAHSNVSQVAITTIQYSSPEYSIEWVEPLGLSAPDDMLIGGAGDTPLIGETGGDSFGRAYNEGRNTTVAFIDGEDFITLGNGSMFGSLTFADNNIIPGTESLTMITGVDTSTLDRPGFVRI
ncbi:MAG: integrin alpha [Cyanobacteria bacterium P01_F01_bin.150]